MACQHYREYFPAETSSKLTITVNGGVLPSNTNKIEIYMNGVKLVEGAGLDYTLSGSQVLLSFGGGGNHFEVLFTI